MRTSIFAAAALVASTIAAPTNEIADIKRSIIKRQSVTSGVSDLVILNFALTLEHLENTFYTQAVAKYTDADFVKAGYTGVYAFLEQVQLDEASHVAFLTSAITAAGGTPVQACTYNFPYNSVSSFLGLSQIFEGVGASAYLGAAGAINGSAYVTAAGSILTVEARHNTFVRFLNSYAPVPAPYDTPLSAAAVVTLVTPFFASCPTGSAPTIMGKPALTVNTTTPSIGGAFSVSPTNATAFKSNGTVYCGFASGLGAGFSTWTNGQCTIPTSNVTAGQTYVVLTTGPSVADAYVLAGPAVFEIGTANFTVNLATKSGSGGNAAANSSSTAAGASSTLAAGASIMTGSAALAFLAGSAAMLL